MRRKEMAKLRDPIDENVPFKAHLWSGDKLKQLPSTPETDKAREAFFIKLKEATGFEIPPKIFNPGA
jgi:hypothetical protein